MEQNNQGKQKNKGLIFIVVLLLTITLIASCVGLYAWAKYTSSQNGNATAQIAKWSFDLRLKEGKSGATETSGPIDLASTQFNHVANDRIAPGTSGLFYVIIDTTGTEVDCLYEVNIGLTNCPRNIKFYRGTDANGEELSLGGVDSTTRSFSFSRYLQAKKIEGGNTVNENTKHEEPIYWVWDYNGSVGGNSTTYDQWDTLDSQLGTTTMTITARGTEMLEPPAAPVAKAIGDSVNYTTSLNGVTLDDWSVFYVDGDYTYIILDDYLPNAAVNLTDINKFGNYSVNTDEDRETLVNTMTNKSNWNALLAGTLNGTSIDYSQSTDTDIWAMGSPTLELWTNSWNQVYPSDRLYIEQTASVMDDGLYGWYVGDSANPEENEVYTVDFNRLTYKAGYENLLYFPHKQSIGTEDCNGYWLASHSAGDYEYAAYVYFDGSLTGKYYADYDVAFRPVIKLPTSVVNQ